VLGLKEGTLLDVTLAATVSKETAYTSKIYDYNRASKTVLMYIPRKYGVDLDLSKHKGNFLIVAYTNRYLVKYKCSFLKHIDEDGVVLAAIKVLDEGDKVQRRQFYRLYKTMDIKFDLEAKEAKKVSAKSKLKPTINPDLMKAGSLEEFLDSFEALTAEEKPKEDSESYPGTLIDISGGGIHFYSNQKLEKENVINVHFVLDGKELSVKGEIINKVESLGTNFLFEYRVQFIKPPMEAQKYILDYIWKEQRMQQKIVKAPKSV